MTKSSLSYKIWRKESRRRGKGGNRSVHTQRKKKETLPICVSGRKIGGRRKGKRRLPRKRRGKEYRRKKRGKLSTVINEGHAFSLCSLGGKFKGGRGSFSSTNFLKGSSRRAGSEKPYWGKKNVNPFFTQRTERMRARKESGSTMSKKEEGDKSNEKGRREGKSIRC